MLGAITRRDCQILGFDNIFLDHGGVEKSLSPIWPSAVGRFSIGVFSFLNNNQRR